MTISPLDLDKVDIKDGILLQRGLQQLGLYSGTFGGVPGANTKKAYSDYRNDVPQGPTDIITPLAAGAVLDYSRKVEVEVEFPGEIANRSRGIKARRVQEWLTFHNFRTAVDDHFGDATERSVRSFQDAHGLANSGKVDEDTWNSLVAPMVRAFSAPGAAPSLPAMVMQIALQHLQEHPVEIGGQNKGPWVRAYMTGNEGNAWPWCAGFVTFVMKQAAQILGTGIPVDGSFSCDLLASQAKNAGRFVSERDLDRNPDDFSTAKLGNCCIFLVRRTSSDWTHTGFAFNFSGSTFETIEGNTNDEGSREGYEVCRRTRSRKDKDFITLV